MCIRDSTWYNNQADTYGSEETMELDVQPITQELQQLLTPIMIQAGAAYNSKYSYPCERTTQIMDKFTGIRFNRYGGGQIMIARAQKYSMDYLGPGFPEYTAGDVNFDDTINIQDVLMILDMDFGYG